jgi:hypothetical protein
MVTTVTDNSPQAINTSHFSLDKQVQEIKTLTDTFNDKISGINPKANVISVNGKQGIVTLNAQDVHALPDTTVIPTTTGELTNNSGFITIEDVGASYVPLTRKVNNKELDTDITLTASDVGALPDSTVVPTKTSQLTNDSDFVTSSGRVANATYADTFRATYISTISPAQAAAMTEGNRSWPLGYGKDYLQSVTVTWEDYGSHNFPAGAAGYFFPGYGSNGGTLVLVNYPSNRMLYNVWIDSNRWSGWHYVDLNPITYS